MTDAKVAYQNARRAVLNALPKGAVGAEVGVWKGDFSAEILATAAPACLHLIDPWCVSDAEEHGAAWYGTAAGVDMDAVYAGVAARFANEIEAGRVQMHRKKSTAALSELPEESLDFIYVDGDHRYEAVSEDLHLSVQAVRSGGLICADDHYLGKWWGDGVVRAVNELLGAHSAELILLFAAHGQVVMRKR